LSIRLIRKWRKTLSSRRLWPDEGNENEEIIHPASEDDVQSIEREDTKLVERTEELTGEGDGKAEFDWDNYCEDYGRVGVTYERKDTEAPAWDNIITESKSLTEHLMWQMKLSTFSEEEMRVGAQIVAILIKTVIYVQQFRKSLLWKR